MGHFSWDIRILPLSNWDIGIFKAKFGILGYCSDVHFWSNILLGIQVSLTRFRILAFGPYEIGILGYGSPEIGIFGIPGPPLHTPLFGICSPCNRVIIGGGLTCQLTFPCDVYLGGGGFLWGNILQCPWVVLFLRGLIIQNLQ